MTRFLPLLIAASLIATPGLAGGFSFDLPHMTFPETAPVTQSTSGPATTQPVQPQD